MACSSCGKPRNNPKPASGVVVTYINGQMVQGQLINGVFVANPK